MDRRSSTKNAIEKRLDLLATHWNQFAEDPKPRLLRWMVDEDGARMLEVFFETQYEEDISETPDLFVRLNAPCDSPDYAQTLVEELLQQYLDNREALKQEGIDADWYPPEEAMVSSRVDKLALCAISFQEYYSASVPTLVLVLTPSNIVSVETWISVLHDLTRRLPSCVRVTVVDRVETPLLDHLASTMGDLVTTLSPDLDMPAAILQLANEEGRTGPGVEFRRRFMELSQLVPTGDLAAIQTKAKAALAIAQEQNWISLQFAVQMLVAAAHCNADRSQYAVACYQMARETAERAETNDEPGARKLILQARFGEAAALLQQGAYIDAAQVYEQSVNLVSKEEPLLQLECWRMAGYCHEQSHSPQAAWQALWNAVDVAEHLNESTRQQSTLAYAGEALLRLTERPEYQIHTRLIHNRMTALLGSGWREAARAEKHAV